MQQVEENFLPPEDSKIGKLLRKKMEELALEQTEKVEEDVDEENFVNYENLFFRNYKPRSKILEKRCMKEVLNENSTENLIQEVLGNLFEEVKENKEIQLVPTKLNYDLKRDLSKKLKILNQRTQKVINEIREEKMQEEDSDSSEYETDSE
eukprot:gene9537-1742_t